MARLYICWNDEKSSMRDAPLIRQQYLFKSWGSPSLPTIEVFINTSFLLPCHVLYAGKPLLYRSRWHVYVLLRFFVKIFVQEVNFTHYYGSFCIF